MSEAKKTDFFSQFSKLPFAAKLITVIFLSIVLSFYLVMTSAPCHCEQEHDVLFMLPYVLALGLFNALWFINGTEWSAILIFTSFFAPTFLCVIYALFLRLSKPRRAAGIVSLIHVVPSAITLLCVVSGKTYYTLFRRGVLDGLDAGLLIPLFVVLFLIIGILASIRKASRDNQPHHCEKGGCKP